MSLYTDYRITNLCRFYNIEMPELMLPLHIATGETNNFIIQPRVCGAKYANIQKF